MLKRPDAADNRPTARVDVIIKGQVRFQGDAKCLKVSAECDERVRNGNRRKIVQ